MTNVRGKVLALSLMAGMVGGGLALSHQPTEVWAGPSAAVALTDASIPDIAERVVDSVVNIRTQTVQKGPASFDPFWSDDGSPFFGQEPSLRQKMSKGSGVIVSSSGRILTNAHVVNGATDIVVTLHDGTDIPAKVIGIDKKADLAVIQLQGGNLPRLKPLPFGDSGDLRLGEVVLAVGDPFGVGKSVTMGIVSAKGRSGMGIEDYEDFIQTDAAINPGNSGGALVNLKGELVGINTAIASPTGGYAGIGFAIPTNMARPIMDELVKHGKVARGYLGVTIAGVTPDIAKEYSLGASRGAAVMEVQRNSPAARAGLEEGDVITKINGAEIRSSDVFTRTIGGIKPGTVVELTVATQKNGTKTVKAKLDELPEDAQTRIPTRRMRGR
ncbi:MAG: trypsin-like peptidase domain-containing protein [Kofleriaceae bacterium]